MPRRGFLLFGLVRISRTSVRLSVRHMFRLQPTFEEAAPVVFTMTGPKNVTIYEKMHTSRFGTLNCAVASCLGKFSDRETDERCEHSVLGFPNRAVGEMLVLEAVPAQCRFWRSPERI